ncbi:MAG: filamentous hemagglutinin N-terminal domain-containing protein [Rhodocyclales bacterium]|nr:filamentous hemagglutinin N-terminal domain-containing protein [Rhodocyclales bacterium]
MIHTNRKPLALLIAAVFAPPLFAAAPAPDVLPSGGRVTAGSASIAHSVIPGGARMDVTQTSPRAILEWQRFDIGSNAQVNFAQPNTSSIALNRVLAGEASQIMAISSPAAAVRWSTRARSPPPTAATLHCWRPKRATKASSSRGWAALRWAPAPRSPSTSKATAC